MYARSKASDFIARLIFFDSVLELAHECLSASAMPIMTSNHFTKSPKGPFRQCFVVYFAICSLRSNSSSSLNVPNKKVMTS